MALIKSISGIRGTIGGKSGDNLTPLDIAKFTLAYASIILQKGGNKVVVGRDARISGEMVYHNVVGNLLGLGIDVIDLGLATTPTVEMAVVAESADGGIIITASHNPRQWNALKLLNKRGEFISESVGAEIIKKSDKAKYDFAEIDKIDAVDIQNFAKQIFTNDKLNLALIGPFKEEEEFKKILKANLAILNYRRYLTEA